MSASELSSNPGGQPGRSGDRAEPPAGGQPALPPEARFALKGLIKSYPSEARHLLPLLTAVQTRFRYLPEAALREIAEHLELPLARVFAVAGFYRALSLEPQGDRVIKVCCGTACHLKGAPDLIKVLEKELNLNLGETRADRAFTLESVNCLGACALAPVLMLDEKIYGEISPAETLELIKSPPAEPLPINKLTVD